jgi:hypothetical protein
MLPSSGLIGPGKQPAVLAAASLRCGYQQHVVDLLRSNPYARAFRHKQLCGWIDHLVFFRNAMFRLTPEDDFACVKACEGQVCSLLSLDKTARARRWCSMAICGNRAKVAAFRARGLSWRPDRSFLCCRRPWL